MRPPRWQLLAAYAAIYFIWGSTYLAIKWSVETIPPAFAMGARSLLGGAAMLALAFALRARLPSRREMLAAVVIGTLFFAGNQGLLATAQTRLPSGAAALLIATIPFFVPALVWALGGGRPAPRTALGVGIGVAGVAVLAKGGAALGMAAPIHIAITLFAAFNWSLGTVLATRLPRPPSLLVGAGLQLACGGVVLVALGLLFGQGDALHLDQVSLRSLAGMAYLLVFGTFLGFGAFVWLTRHEPPTRIATYAFVNPVVAVLIGHMVEGEAIDGTMLSAMAMIVAAVALIVVARR